MNEFPGYEKEHEEYMRTFFRSLPEDHRRRYAAIEALKIGFGGISYISRTLLIARNTIMNGVQELETMHENDPQNPERPSGQGRIRREGAGRPKESERQPSLEKAIGHLVESHSAGSPTDSQVKWTDLTPGQLMLTAARQGYLICRNTAATLLDDLGFRRRTLRKTLITGHVNPEERNTQFEHIAALRQSYHARGLPFSP